jgi:hypothetical protein
MTTLSMSTLRAGGCSIIFATLLLAQLPEERLRSVETEQKYMQQALKDSQESTRFLITGFASLMLLIQVVSSIVQARREDRAYVKQNQREDQLEGAASLQILDRAGGGS